MADSYNHKIRRIDLNTATVKTWLGSGKAGKSLNPAQLSEPGGLSVGESDLYIADTNNHRICRANLDDATLSVVQFEGLKPPKPPKRRAFDEVKPVVLEARAVRPGESINVTVKLDVPEGYKINKQMPVTWEAANVDEKAIFAKEPAIQARTTAKGQLVNISIPLDPAAKQGQIQLIVKYGYCRDGVGGLCKMTTKCWRLPLTTSSEGTTELQIP